MGYTHGTKWSDTKIIKEIMHVQERLEITTMPTHSQIEIATYSKGLSNAISRSGGTEFWANKLGLEIKNSESKLGESMEMHCCEFIRDKFDIKCEKMKPRYPYDLLVNDRIKIDVKTGFKYCSRNSAFYTFNLEKQYPTCDVYIAYCLNDNKTINKTYVIPANILIGKTQLSVGIHKSKYDVYIDEWDIISKMNKMYSKIA